jgi:pyruvate carboxylase
MRFLREDPWARLAAFRESMPNLLLQMLFRSANAVGYTNYSDNVVRYFVARAAEAGIDVFRVFDCLNWTDNMRVAIEAVLETGRLCEAAICYSGNLTNPRETKYDLKYYIKLAKELRAMGAHILAIKDMGGLCQPRAAATLVRVLKEEVGLPIHFHTHDTSGIAAASVLAAVEAGVDAVLDPAVEFAFPDFVVHLFHGDLGQPSGGFPADLQTKSWAAKHRLAYVRAKYCRRPTSRRSAGSRKPKWAERSRSGNSHPT